MKKSLNRTERKIALLFSSTVSILVFITAILVLFFLQLSIERSAKNSLKNTLTSLETEFEEDAQLKEKNINLQSSNLKNALESESESKNESKTDGKYYDSREIVDIQLPNISEQSKFRKNITQDENQVVIDKDADLASLESNQAVYSRVILPNGDILFSSDLFEENIVDHQVKGFQKISTRNSCIYSYNGTISEGENKDAIVQVALYCPLTRAEERTIILYAVLATVAISGLSYFIGYSVAKRLLQPVKKSAEQTLTFTRNVYHELLTPLTVALSTAQTKLKTGKYKEGLESVKEDLENTTSSLDLLKAKLMQHDAKLKFQEIKIGEILNELLNNYSSRIEEKKLDIYLQLDEISLKGDKVIIRLLFKNLIDNAVKYSPVKSDIKIELNEKYLKITNPITKSKDKSKSKSNGIGLKLVADMCKILSWEFTYQKEENLFKAIILF
jgi:signal transduction histidine kinase